jgi:hypothetical protein
VITDAAYGFAPPPELQRQDVAALLQHAYQWTCAAATAVPAVAQQVAPALTIAAQLYEAQQYPAAIGQLAGAVTTLRQTRRAFPALPEL